MCSFFISFFGKTSKWMSTHKYNEFVDVGENKLCMLQSILVYLCLQSLNEICGLEGPTQLLAKSQLNLSNHWPLCYFSIISGDIWSLNVLLASNQNCDFTNTLKNKREFEKCLPKIRNKYSSLKVSKLRSRIRLLVPACREPASVLALWV